MREFQSTHSMRSATKTPIMDKETGEQFQSTHSMRSATDGIPSILKKNYFNPRTPCGVRRNIGMQIRFQQRYFNPRTPCGVRPIRLRIGMTSELFQSTHSMRSATSTVFSFSATRSNFNPRTPCGVRPQINANSLKKFPLICISFSFKPTTNNIYSHI